MQMPDENIEIPPDEFDPITTGAEHDESDDVENTYQMDTITSDLWNADYTHNDNDNNNTNVDIHNDNNNTNIHNDNDNDNTNIDIHNDNDNDNDIMEDIPLPQLELQSTTQQQDHNHNENTILSGQSILNVINADYMWSNLMCHYADPHMRLGGVTVPCTNHVYGYIIIPKKNKKNPHNENNGVYKGFIDGFMVDPLLNFSVKENATEKWIYLNLDNQDTHPFHFHLTSGYLCPDKKSYSKYVNRISGHYSTDVIAIGSQQFCSFYVKFKNYNSEKYKMIINDKKFKNLGYMCHCHYLSHENMNMMIQYFVHSF
jgi:FtsP/CotA-like multicopper oxidase with cupredoxin domain